MQHDDGWPGTPDGSTPEALSGEQPLAAGAPPLRKVSGQLPPQDLDAERIVLDHVIGLGGLEGCDGLTAAHFYSHEHQELWQAIRSVLAKGRALDYAAVGAELRERGGLDRVGGLKYLIDLQADTPATARVGDHAAIVLRHARARELQWLLHEANARLYDGTDAAVAMADVLAWVDRTPAGQSEQAGTIIAAWQPLPMAALTEQPPPRKYLLRHPTQDGQPCAPESGDGLLPRGKVGVLTSEGGLGKTYALVALAVSVVTGRPWLGHFAVDWAAREGRVLLALAEEDKEEAHRRMYEVAAAYHLTDDERARCVHQIVVLPMAGFPVSLTAWDDHAVVETDAARDLRSRLLSDAGEFGWSLVVLDPLARWAGGDAEANNESATRFVQCAESLVAAPGNPTVLVSHHTSKDARKAGVADSRGVTGITDGFRWHATLTAEGADVMFQQKKSNYSRPMLEPLRLIRVGKVLRIPTDEETNGRAYRDEVAKADALEDDVARVVAALEKRPRGLGSIDVIARAAGIRLSDGRAAFHEAMSRGLITKLGTSKDPCYLTTSNTSGGGETPRTPQGRRTSTLEGADVHVPEAEGTPRDVGTFKPDGTSGEDRK